jgi:hypothetical protein
MDMMAPKIYPYGGSRYDKYWKYENPDPSTNQYAVRVALEIIELIQDKISKRGKQIYGVRPEAIIVQDLRHAVIRELLKILAEHDKLIEKYERENSGNIDNYFDSEGVEHVLGEDQEQEDLEEKGEGEGSVTSGTGKFSEGDDDMDKEYDLEE